MELTSASRKCKTYGQQFHRGSTCLNRRHAIIEKSCLKTPWSFRKLSDFSRFLFLCVIFAKILETESKQGFFGDPGTLTDVGIDLNAYDGLLNLEESEVTHRRSKRFLSFPPSSIAMLKTKLTVPLFDKYDSYVGEYGSYVSEYESYVSEYESYVCEYDSCVGEYVSCVGEYDSYVGECDSCVGEYVSYVGEYDSYVGEYDSYVSEYDSYVGECDSCVGECDSYVGEYDSYVGEYDSYVGEYDSYVGEYDSYVGVYDSYVVGTFKGYTTVSYTLPTNFVTIGKSLKASGSDVDGSLLRAERSSVAEGRLQAYAAIESAFERQEKCYELVCGAIEEIVSVLG
ncbi:hypothetical protein FHG87_015871 [Trinorchestia longiramus]|nr:hypothetical protein FHG87_015871 [Trinorchestia longiramus]